MCLEKGQNRKADGQVLISHQQPKANEKFETCSCWEKKDSKTAVHFLSEERE